MLTDQTPQGGTTTTTTTNAPAQQGQQGQQQDPGQGEGQQQDRPPWGDDKDFSPERAWNLIKGLRSDLKDARAGSAEATRLRNQIAEIKPLADEAQKLRDEKKTETEKLTEKAAAAEKAAQTALLRAVRGDIKAAAAAGFADPEDAAAFLDPAKYLTADGSSDSKAIKADLDDLLKRKPHLAREATRRAPAPDRSQGSSGNGQRATAPRDVFAAFINSQRAGQARR